MHICVSNLIIIGTDNGLSPGRRQAIIWTNAGILLIGLLGTNFSEILIEICIFSFKKMHLKLSGKWPPFCLGLNVLRLLYPKASVNTFYQAVSLRGDTRYNMRISSKNKKVCSFKNVVIFLRTIHNGQQYMRASYGVSVISFNLEPQMHLVCSYMDGDWLDKPWNEEMRKTMNSWRTHKQW